MRFDYLADPAAPHLEMDALIKNAGIPGAWGYREGYTDGKRSGLVTGSLAVFIPSLLALVIWWSMHKLAGG